MTPEDLVDEILETATDALPDRWKGLGMQCKRKHIAGALCKAGWKRFRLRAEAGLD